MAKTTFSSKPSAAKAPEVQTAPVSGESLKPATAAETVSPSPTSTAPEPASSAPAVTVPAVIQPQPVAPNRPFDDENIETTDIVLPRVNIAQKVGDLGNQFPPGTVVLAQKLQLLPAPAPGTVGESMEVVVIGFQPKKYVEKVPYGTKGGNVFDTEREVVQAGGTLSYQEAQSKKCPYYERLATALLLVKQPKNAAPEEFPIEIGGNRYVLALYAMKGSSYTEAAKQFMTAKKMGYLGDSYRNHVWSFAAMLKKFLNGNSAYVPVVKQGAKTPPEVKARIAELLGF